jgi:tRNA/tmRNA/rRNA uracil-C5-methylase (TrmA/RlmC/RlmD family)
MILADKAPVQTPEITLKIDDLSRGGAGVARDESGRVTFVPFTAPGDTVRVRWIEESKRYAQAELLEVIEPSPIRQKSPCPVFGRCGGCQWHHIPYELQWKTKKAGVLHALERINVSIPGEIDSLPAEKIWNYRNRIQLRGHRDELGFYAARSHDRVAIDSCAIAREELNAALSETRAEGQKFTEPYKVEIEVLPDGSVRKVWNSRHAAGGFRQVHDEQNEKLRAWVSERVSKGGRVLDLFGGAGNLGAPVSLFSESVDCVDMTAPEGTEMPEFPKLRFHRSPVSKWLRKQKGVFTTAILDPPREGLADDFEQIATSLEYLRVREIVAVGCDPDSWARDLGRFVKRGWKLNRVGVLDLFPQTPHVESLGLLML